MNFPTVEVNGVSVRIDDEGRYNLNDLHAAAVLKGQATPSQRPSNFLRSRQIKRFAQSLSDAQKCASVDVIKGGLNQGVWGLELLAIRYAAWLSPDFEIKVYSTFRDYVLNGISTMAKLQKIELTIDSERREVSESARKMSVWGRGGRKKMLSDIRDNLIDQIQPDLLTGME